MHREGNATNDDSNGSDDTLIDFESKLRARIEKLVEKKQFHETMSMNASTLPFRVNHRNQADILCQEISKLRRTLRGVRRGSPVYHDIFSIEPFTK